MSSLETVNSQNEIWQVEVGGQIYEANFEELAQWIDEGALQPQDRVRRGNLRWLEANKIPALYGFFNAKELGLPMPAVTITTTKAVQSSENIPAKTENSAAQMVINAPQNSHSSQTVNPNQLQNSAVSTSQFLISEPSNFCILHPHEESKFVCTGCGKSFCKTCPKSYGGSVKVCPSCGEMCKAVSEVKQNQNKNFQYQHDLSEGFGFADFGKALAYPFKFRFSLISGAILFMVFTLGKNAAGFGGLFMVFAALFCAMMANGLTFGVLAKTVENMSQGKLNKDFMPWADDFNLWDDVIHPFFLSIGAYIASFGFLIVLVLGMVWYMWHTVTQSAVSLSPANIEQMKNLGNTAPKQPRFENGQVIFDDEDLTPAQREAKQNDDILKMQELIQKQRQGQLESVVGKTPETQQQEKQQMLQNILKIGIPFLILGVLAALWGLFYFPAACAVAGYTQSFSATINPLVGLDTIKRMGADYIKILVMCFLMGAMSLIINGIFALIFSPFDLPQIGNLPAQAVGSLFTFYLSVVFAVTIGYALYKNSAKLNLLRG